LEQNYPNPFNPATAVKFTLDKPGNVSLKIYNVAGQLVKTLLDNVDMNGGSHTVGVDLSGVTSGTYFYVLQQGNRIIAKKMMLVAGCQ